MIKTPDRTFKYIVFTLWIVLSCTIIFSWVGDLVYRHFVINHSKTPYHPILCKFTDFPWTYLIGLIPIIGPVFCKMKFYDQYEDPERLEIIKEKFRLEQNAIVGEDLTYDEHNIRKIKQLIQNMGGDIHIDCNDCPKSESISNTESVSNNEPVSNTDSDSNNTVVNVGNGSNNNIVGANNISASNKKTKIDIGISPKFPQYSSDYKKAIK